MEHCSICGRALVGPLETYGAIGSPLCHDCFAALPAAVAYNPARLWVIRECINGGMPVDHAIRYYLWVMGTFDGDTE